MHELHVWYKSRKSNIQQVRHDLCNKMNAAAICLVLFLSCSYAAAPDDYSDDGYDNYWDNWSRNLNKQISASLRGLDNLGPSISRQVQNGLRPLDNLGDRIAQQVHKGLKPVREMEFKFKIRYGDGGTTVATFKDKRLVIRDKVIYQCDGTISDADGSCSGTLSRLNFARKEDFCYANVNAIINNWYCIGAGSVNTGYVNGKFYCNSVDGSPTLAISAQEYRSLCGDRAGSVTYKYFTNGPLGERGSDVVCSGTGPYVCTFTETRNSNFSVYSATSYVNIY